MKNFIISLLTVLLVFATSCNEMDQYPHNAVSSDNLTEEDAQLLLTGLYFYIQNKPTVNGYLTQDIVGGDLVRGGATGLKDPVLLVKDLVTPESGFVSGPWDGFYTALYQVNSLIVAVEPVTKRDTGSSQFLPWSDLLSPGYPLWRSSHSRSSFFGRYRSIYRNRRMEFCRKEFSGSNRLCSYFFRQVLRLKTSGKGFNGKNQTCTRQND